MLAVAGNNVAIGVDFRIEIGLPAYSTLIMSQPPTFNGGWDMIINSLKNLMEQGFRYEKDCFK